MKKCFSRYRLALFALTLMTSITYANQIWRDVFVNNVVDEDLVIKDDVLLNVGGTYIEAIHKDVTVTLTKDVTLRGNWSAPSQLYLVAAAGRTIRFILDHDMTFVGSSPITGDDLLVVQSGPGTVEMVLSGGKEFAITSEECSGGVQMYVLMYGGQSAPNDEYCGDEYTSSCPCSCSPNVCDEYACKDEYSPGSGCDESGPARPTLRFVGNAPTDRLFNKNVFVRIGRNSRLSYLSSRTLDIASDSGIIEFDPSSATPGRMVLTVNDRGAFNVSGHYTCQRNGGAITLGTINLAKAAGKDAIWSIVNSRGPNIASGLLVLNENETLFDLLVDPFLNLDTRNKATGYQGSFSGCQYGVVVGANATLAVLNNSYLDYVGLALNQIPATQSCRAVVDFSVGKFLKLRNSSALFVDGNNNPESVPARVLFGSQAAIFFRSGVADDGTIRPLDDVDPFTIDADLHTRGVGNIVFDVEGALDVRGPVTSGGTLAKIELLSLEVVPTGGSLFVGGGETDFPLRTFNMEDGALLAYNTGAFLINNTMSLYDTSLSHTDVNHRVFQDNDNRSEPTYIGGETFKLLDSPIRPNIQFFNSRLLVNANIATTGVDLVVPNLVDDEGVMHTNHSNFVFYSNGACVDNGTGRQMILGTRIGSTAIDGCSRIDGDSHLDIMELFNQTGSDIDPLDPDGDQTLNLTTQFNDATIDSLVEDPTTFSIHTIFLGGNSNISIGVNADTTGFNIDTHPWLRIEGNFFSFTSRGGRFGPDTSNITGKGGIFVDLNGKISIDPGLMASFCVMVTKSHNGIVDLPADQVFFCDGTGIADWDVNLSNPNSQVLVPAGQEIGDYVFNWIIAKKDCKNFVPYQIGELNMCECPPVTQANVSSLPTIEGVVDRLLIQGSRFGDPAQILVNGGTVRSISFDNNNISGQAPVAIITLQNEGQVFLGANVFGNNGTTIIANGSGRIDLVDDVVINGHCAIVKGPDFVEGNVLTINAAVDREIRLKSSGVLDLRTFDQPTDIIQLLGEVRLVVEPGARIILGGGVLSFAGNSQLIFEPAVNVAQFFAAIPHGDHDPLLNPLGVVDAALPHNALAGLINYANGLNNTDAFRVRIMGVGTLLFQDFALGLLPYNAFVGIETFNDGVCQITDTNINLMITDSAQFVVGRLDYDEGGVLQVGNVQDLTSLRALSHSVKFTITMDGDDAIFSVGSRGFVGLGVGIERFDGTDQDGNLMSNENIVNTLFNVVSVTFQFNNGRFEHNRIYSGDDARASLMAIGNQSGVTYNLLFGTQDDNADAFAERISDFNLSGGGNLALIGEGQGGLHPVVLDQDGTITPRLSASVMASTLLQSINENQENITGAELFDLLKTHDAVLEDSRDNTIGRANAADSGQNVGSAFSNFLVDTVSNGVIVRTSVFDIIGSGTELSKQQATVKAGAVMANINAATNQIINVAIVPGA